MNIRYIASYIQSTIYSDDPIPLPDPSKSGNWIEQLYALYHSHKAGAAKGAWKVWTTYKIDYPELEKIVRQAESLVHVSQLRFLTSPSYLLQDYPLYYGGLNFIVGASGHGKSFVALDIASRVAVNEAVVYIAGEGMEGYKARALAWCNYHQVNDESLHLWFYKEALQIMNQMEMEMFLDLVMSHKPRLVIIDTLARSAVGLDENHSKDMGTFINAADYIRAKLNSAVIIVHHTGKSGDMRGSTALYGAADAVITVCKIEGLVRVSNHSTVGGKDKYHEDNFESWFKITAHEVDGLEGAIIAPAEKIEDVASQVTDLQLSILAVLKRYTDGALAKDVIKELNKNRGTVYKNLGKLVEMQFVSKQHETYFIEERGLTVLDVFGEEGGETDADE